MGRWKTLPEGLEPTVARLVVQLRRMKDDSGLSLSQLANRTGYSTSSWNRYLSGRALAPRDAVQALVEIVEADAVAMLVLHETAQWAWRTGSEEAEPQEAQPQEAQPDEAQPDEAQPDEAQVEEAQPPQPGADGPAEPGRGRARDRPGVVHRPGSGFVHRPGSGMVLNSALSAAVGAVIALLAVQPWHSAAAATPVPRPTAAPARSYGCHYTRLAGKWYAGNSTTSTDLVTDGMDGPDVAEVQCLLQHSGINPGGVDGIFGPLTLDAVIHEQLARHLVVDGQVGSQTWAALRG